LSSYLLPYAGDPKEGFGQCDGGTDLSIWTPESVLSTNRGTHSLGHDGGRPSLPLLASSIIVYVFEIVYDNVPSVSHPRRPFDDTDRSALGGHANSIRRV
jgi:hypothetical protein